MRGSGDPLGLLSPEPAVPGRVGCGGVQLLCSLSPSAPGAQSIPGSSTSPPYSPAKPEAVTPPARIDGPAVESVPTWTVEDRSTENLEDQSEACHFGSEGIWGQFLGQMKMTRDRQIQLAQPVMGLERGSQAKAKMKCTQESRREKVNFCMAFSTLCGCWPCR